MTKYLFLNVFILFLLGVANWANAAGVSTSCVRAAERTKLVTVNYNYGNLEIIPKNMQEISRLCSENAAGCFLSGTGFVSSIDTKDIKIGSCMTKQITVNLDFTGSVLYITSDYDPCNARAVLRHELQHFMNWKTSKEQLIREIKIALKRWAINNMQECRNGKACSMPWHSEAEIRSIVSNAMSKWFELGQKNDKMLDSIDHDHHTEVNYSVCAPYSFKVSQ